jgi:hypothetical protein
MPRKWVDALVVFACCCQKRRPWYTVKSHRENQLIWSAAVLNPLAKRYEGVSRWMLVTTEIVLGRENLAIQKVLDNRVPEEAFGLLLLLLLWLLTEVVVGVSNAGLALKLIMVGT